MHEISLAGGILQMVEQAQAREPFDRVIYLRLEAGALCGVDVSALRFALEAMSPGTCLQAATIDIDEPAAAANCPQCGQCVAIRSRLDPCPHCGSYPLQATGGTELRVMDLRVV